MTLLTRDQRSEISKYAQRWTPQQDTVLRRMWAEKASTAVIGQAVGKTKNSVISRRRTLGLPMRGTKNSNPTGLTVTLLRTPKSAASPRLPIETLPTPAVLTAPKSSTDIGHRQCRYIGKRPDLLTLDTPIYCGAPTDGGSWCPAHKARVFDRRPMRTA